AAASVAGARERLMWSSVPGSPPLPPVDRRALLNPWPRIGARGALLAIGVFLLYAWGLAGTQVKPAEFVAGIPHIVDFIRRLLPPAWKTVQMAGPARVTIAVPEIALAIIETIQMAIVGTSLAIVISLPFGLLAARNTSPHRAVYQATRLLLNMI